MQPSQIYSYTVGHKKTCHFVFDLTPALPGRFLCFFTSGNRNEYSTEQLNWYKMYKNRQRVIIENNMAHFYGTSALEMSYDNALYKSILHYITLLSSSTEQHGLSG